MLTRTCTRCGHTWIARRPNPPKQCPHCTTPYWNVPRRATPVSTNSQAPSEPVLVAVSCTNPRCLRIGVCTCDLVH